MHILPRTGQEFHKKSAACVGGGVAGGGCRRPGSCSGSLLRKSVALGKIDGRSSRLLISPRAQDGSGKTDPFGATMLEQGMMGPS